MASRGSLHDVVAALCLAALTALASPAWAQVPELPPGVDISDLDPNDLPPGVDITDLDPNDLPPGVDVPPGLVPTGDASGGGDGTTPPADGDEVIAQGAPDPESEPTPDPAPETPESGPTTGAGTQPASPTSGGGGGTTTANAPRPARPIVTLSRDAVLGGELSWLYSELKQRLAAEGIVLDDEGHQVNLDPSVQIIGGYTVDDFPTEWYEIMADIAAQAGCTDPNRPPEQRDSRCSSMLIAPPGGGGTLTAAETARAGAEQAAADAASAAQGGDGSSDDGPSSTSTGRPDDAPGGPSDSDGSTTPEDDPDLGGNDDGNDSGGTDDGGGNGTDDGGTGATDTGDDAGGNGGGSADERGIVFENTDDAQRARFEEALAFIPVDGVRDGLRVVFQDSQSEGPNTAGQWSQPPPTIQIFPIGHNDPHTMVHELVHEVLEGKLDNGEDRFASVFNSLSEQDKALTTPSRYGAADLSGGPEGFHELAAESFSFYLQNKVTELGQPQVPYRERIPAPVQALWDEMIQELGGLP